MVSFIDEQRDAYGVEPICSVLPIAPSVYFEQKARQADPRRLPLGRSGRQRRARAWTTLEEDSAVVSRDSG